jgi:hypothetical protein
MHAIATGCDVSIPMAAAAHPPNIMLQTPMRTKGLSRLVALIMKPVLTLDTVMAMEEATSRKPEAVGEVSFTAWKYSGALNTIVFIDIPAKKLPKIMLARGFVVRSSIGITGRGTRLS